MIELTREQRQELERPEAVRVRDPKTGELYVLVPVKMYERLQVLLDDTIWPTAELVDQVMAEDDANDPYLAEYQKLYGEGPR